MTLFPYHPLNCQCSQCFEERHDIPRTRYFKIRHTSHTLEFETVVVKIYEDDTIKLRTPEQMQQLVRVHHEGRLKPHEIISIEECSEDGGPPPKPENILLTDREAREITNRINNQLEALGREIILAAIEYTKEGITIAQLTAAFDNMKRAIKARETVADNDPDRERLQKYYDAKRGPFKKFFEETNAFHMDKKNEPA